MTKDIQHSYCDRVCKRTSSNAA